MIARETVGAARRRGAAMALAVAVSWTAAASGAERWVAVGPPGGSVRALASDPEQPELVYLGTANGTLYRSEDGGLHWQRTNPGFPRRGVSLDDIVVAQDGRLYVGFWEIDGRGGGVALSRDRGKTFTLLKGVDGQSVRALAVAPFDPQVIAAGTLDGVFVSRTGGRVWRRLTPAGHPTLRNVESLAFDPLDPRVLYVGTWHLSWMTPDAGATWVPMHRGMIDDSDVMTLTVDPRDPRVLWATACTGIYRSNGIAQGWTQMRGVPESSRRTRAFSLASSDGSLLAGTTQGLWMSDDDGASWRCATRKDLVVNALLVQPDGSILVGADDVGVLRSADRGRTWSPSNAGFSERFVSDLRFDPRSGGLLIAVRGDARFGGVFAAPGPRGPWAQTSDGLEGRTVLALAIGGPTVFAGTDQGIYARDAGTGRWSPLGTAARGTADTGLRVSALLAGPSGRLIAATSRGLIRSADGGRSWSRRAAEMGETVWALASAVDGGERVVAATARGFFLSSDGGVRWTLASPPLAGVVPHAIAFLPSDDRVLFATTSAGLYRSDDRAASWQRVAGVPHSDLTGIAVWPDGRTLGVTDFTWGGIFRSTDAGRTWSRMPVEGLASDRVWTIGLDPAARSGLLVGAAAGGLHLLVSP